MKHLLLTVLLIGICLMSFSSPPGVRKDTVVLQLKWQHQFQFAGFYAAIEKGFYEKEGLEVIVREGNTGVNFVQEVLSGNAHYGLESSRLIISRNSNMPVVALAAIFQHSPEILLTHKKTNISQIEDLHDKRISLGINGLSSIRALLKKINISEAQFIYGSSSGYLNDLMNDRTDAVTTYITDAPFLLQKAGYEPVIFKPRSYGIDLYGDILFTSQKEVEENKNRTKRFIEASIKGWSYAMNNKQEIIDLILKKYNPKLSRDELIYEANIMEELVMPNLIEVGQMSAKRWKYIGDIFVEIGLLHPLYSIDGFLFEDYILFKNKRIKQYTIILLAIVAISLITLLLFFLFNRRLKNSVSQRTTELSRVNQNLKEEITRRKLAHANLTLSEARFKQIFEDSPISLWEEDFSETKKMIDNLAASGIDDIEAYISNSIQFVEECAHKVKILDVNKATLQYMEVDHKKVLQQGVDKVFTKEALSDFAKELICFYRGDFIYETESEHTTFRGNQLIVSITVKIPKGYESTWSKVLVSMIDITDLKHTTNELKNKEIQLLQQNEILKGINEELNSAKLKAEESDRLKSAFLSNMSHEIRTPLNGIVGFTDLLKNSEVSPEETNRYLSIIEDNSQQLLRIISDIIDISKIEASQLKIVKVEINIRQLFEKLHEIFSLRIRRLSKDDLVCQYFIDPKLPMDFILLSDVTRLRQILTNLLENAVKFTQKGVIEFGVQLDDATNSLRFYVKDSGVGIKQDRVDQIFDRFFREEERFGANLGGTGLGLSIAKNLVELLGGKIMVESKPGIGSTFFFTHPYSL